MFQFIIALCLIVVIRPVIPRAITAPICFSDFDCAEDEQCGRITFVGPRRCFVCPCLYDGYCTNVIGIAGVVTNFECDCRSGRYGRNCELGVADSFHRRPDLWAVTDMPSERNTQWMNRLQDSKQVSDISVPGTHNTMALYGGLAVSCQSLSLRNQLELGVRFLDIRCRLIGSDLTIHHGMFYQHITFAGVLLAAMNFLSAYPSEFIFMRVKQEYSKESNDKFEERVREYINSYSQSNYSNFWLKDELPTVKEARGKIIVLSDFVTKAPLGISYSSLFISDDWDAKNFSVKWRGVKTNLERAQSGSSSKMYLTFNSAFYLFPREMAMTLNAWLYDYVKGRRGRLGMIAMDYPGPKLVKEIINSNF